MKLPHRSTGIRSAIVVLALTSLAATCRAGAMYSVTDLGPVTVDSVDVFNASGQVAPVPFYDDGRSQAGPYSIYSRATNDGQGPVAGYLLTDGQPTATLDKSFDGFQSVFVSSVNQSGTVVGTNAFEVYQFGHPVGIPFVYTQASGMQTIPSFYSNSSGTAAMSGYAISINDAGLIVGAASVDTYTHQYPTSAFLSNGQQSWDLNTLIAPDSGFLLTSATDIDDAGRIIAQAYDPQGQEHNVLLTPLATPAPEPASWLVMATGGLALSCRRLARRRGACRRA